MRIPITVEGLDPIDDAFLLFSAYDTDTREITQEFSLLMKDLDEVFADRDLDAQIDATETFLEELCALRNRLRNIMNGGIRFTQQVEDIDTDDGWTADRVTGFRVYGTRIIRPGDPGHRDLK